MLDRKVSAKSASSIFYEDYNDIDIFIEDTAIGYRKIFKELISKALDEKFRIEQIFPLGNRKDVIKQCELNQGSDGRKKVYIIDGDLFLINGTERPDLRGLYSLPRYCIENYFFNETGLVEIAYEEDPELEVEEIKEKLDFSKWLKDNESSLIELFIHYALCYKYIPSEQTVGFKVSKLCSSNSGIVCPDKITDRVNLLKGKLTLIISEAELSNEIQSIKLRMQKETDIVLKYVSGKDYLFPLIITRLQSFSKFSLITNPLKVRLAMRSEISELKNLKDYIIE